MNHIKLPNSQLELPYDLIENILKGKTLFFVGAGISVNAGLPMFTKLAKRIVRKASSDGLVSKNKSGNIKKTPDEMLDLLERRIGRTEVITHLQKELKTKKKANINTHKAILKLASLNDENIIITTNFDDLFDKAQNILNDHKITEYKHPNLPNNWELGNSLTYIHGKLDNVNNENLILTQSDFSRHYMLKNHTKFIIDIFYRYQVVFLGYSADDAMLKHLLLAMENDNSFKTPYLLVSDKDQENWKFYDKEYYKDGEKIIENRGVINLIPFSPDNNFTQLHDGLSELSAILYDQPILHLLILIFQNNDQEQTTKLCKLLYMQIDTFDMSKYQYTIDTSINLFYKLNGIKLLRKLLLAYTNIQTSKEYNISKNQKAFLSYVIMKYFPYVDDYETYEVFSQYIVEINTFVDDFSWRIQQEINKIENTSLKQLWFNMIGLKMYLTDPKYSELSFIEQQNILKHELRLLHDDILLNQILKWEFKYSTNTKEFQYRQYNLKDIGNYMPFSKGNPQNFNYIEYLKLMDNKFAFEFLTEFLYNFDKIIKYSESNNHEFNLIECILNNADIDSIIDMNNRHTYNQNSYYYNILILNSLLAHNILPYIDDEFILNILDKHIFYLLSVIILCVKNKEKGKINDKLIHTIKLKLIHNILNNDDYLNKYSQNLLILLVNYFPNRMTKYDMAQLENSSKNLDSLLDELENVKKYPFNHKPRRPRNPKTIKDDNLTNKLLETSQIDEILEIVSEYNIRSYNDGKYEYVNLSDTGKTYSQQQNIKAFNILLHKNINFKNNNIEIFVYGIFQEQSSRYGKDIINELYLKLPKDTFEQYKSSLLSILENVKKSMLPHEISKLICRILKLNISFEKDHFDYLSWYMMSIFAKNGSFYDNWLSFIKDIDNEDNINIANNALIKTVHIHYLLKKTNKEFNSNIQKLFSEDNSKDKLIERYKLLNIETFDIEEKIVDIDNDITEFVYKAFLFLIKNTSDLDDFHNTKICNFLMFAYQKLLLKQSKIKELLKHCDEELLLMFIKWRYVDGSNHDTYVNNIDTYKKDIDFIIEIFPRERDKRPDDFKKILIEHFAKYWSKETYSYIIDEDMEKYINDKLPS